MRDFVAESDRPEVLHKKDMVALQPKKGKKVAAVVKPSGGDLFDKTIFRQMKAPQNFLK